MTKKDTLEKMESNRNVSTRKNYHPPVMQIYGKLNRLTQGSVGNGADANGMMPMSDRKTKENIVKIGAHPLGIGLYLFNYKPEHREVWGHARQFGVMADEVETVMPEAVSLNSNGYKMVNYGMLGITLGI